MKTTVIMIFYDEQDFEKWQAAEANMRGELKLKGKLFAKAFEGYDVNIVEEPDGQADA